MLIDSHAHMDSKDFARDLEQTLLRAYEGGVAHILTMGTDLDTSIQAVELANTNDMVYAAVGFHPHRASRCSDRALDSLMRLSEEPKVVAWGEIGLDFYRNRSPADRQLEVFERQLEIARELELPVVIHDREAHSETLKSVQRIKRETRPGVIHCFSGDSDLAETFIDMGYYISIPGIVTYPQANQLRTVASRLPLERMLVETDAPYLAPVPKRGKRNEPLFLNYTVEEIARLRETDFQSIAAATARNTKSLFLLP